jgi:hypothetical protein
MGVSPLILSVVLAYGLFLGLGAVLFRRYLLKLRKDPEESLQHRILDEIDQLDVQIRIFNERLKRVEDESLLGSGEGQGFRALKRGE